MNNTVILLGFVGILMLVIGCNPPADSTPIPVAPVMNNDPISAEQGALIDPAPETAMDPTSSDPNPADSSPSNPAPEEPSEPADPVWNLIKQRAKFYSQLDPSSDNEVKK